ncbi:MAG: hypothetical protein GQ557_01350 [Mycoplasmataceae bacterium]|nr:hypothetical protein [Mycoplasmataceae bacterium]
MDRPPPKKYDNIQPPDQTLGGKIFVPSQNSYYCADSNISYKTISHHKGNLSIDQFNEIVDNSDKPFKQLDTFLDQILDLKYGLKIYENLEKYINIWINNCLFKCKKIKSKRKRNLVISKLDIPNDNLKYQCIDIIDDFIKLSFRKTMTDKLTLLINFAKRTKLHEYVISTYLAGYF